MNLAEVLFWKKKKRVMKIVREKEKEKIIYKDIVVILDVMNFME